MGRGNRPFRDVVIIGYCWRNFVGKGKNRRYFVGNYVCVVCRHLSGAFRFFDSSGDFTFLQRVRVDSICLFNRDAGRTRLFFIVQKRRDNAEYAGCRGCVFRSGDDTGYSLCNGRSDGNDGRHSFRCGDEHPRTGCGTTSLFRYTRRNGPYDCSRLCRSLSVRSCGNYPCYREYPFSFQD